jgi:DNA-binding MarR family transcriptional regulator
MEGFGYTVNHGCLYEIAVVVIARTRGSGTTSRRDAPKRPKEQVRLGPALRRAWVGYQRRLDEKMTAAGFADRGFPDGRVLRMCSGPAETTVSQIGKQLGITRQGASKIVAGLQDRRYVTLSRSAIDGREKIVKLTPRAVDYLAAQRKAADAIESQIRSELGAEVLANLFHLADVLGGADDLRMSDYLRQMRRVGGSLHADQ